MNMSKASIQLAYDGEALQSGLMDVRDLAPALLAVGRLCEVSSQTLNDDRAEVSVLVKSDFKTGSFEVSLDVVQSIVEAVKYVFSHKDHVTTAKELLEIIGLASGGVGIAGASLLSAIKWLKGRKADKTVKLQNGNIQIQIINNNITQHIEVRPEVVRLLNSEDVREAVQSIVKPLEREGIERLEVREGKEKIEIITEEDMPSFAALNPDIESETLLEGQREVVLQILKPSFDANLKWMFSEGEARFSADIADKDFLKKIERGEIQFTKGDILKAVLWSKTSRSESGLKTEHKVLKVQEILARLRQSSLLPEPTPELPKRKPINQ